MSATGDATGGLEFPEGVYSVWADDDDVIGLTVAKTYPSGWAIVRADPQPEQYRRLGTAFDEYDVADYLASCLTRHAEIVALMWGEGDEGP